MYRSITVLTIHLLSTTVEKIREVFMRIGLKTFGATPEDFAEAILKAKGKTF